MSWSCTRSGEKSQQDGSYFASWTTDWSVEEVTPTESGKIRLKVTVITRNFYSNSNTYVWYSTDTISCGGASIQIHARSQVPGAASYTTYVQVPTSWSNQSVQFKIAWWTETVTLGATGITKSTVSASNGYFGQAIPITLNNSFTGSGVTHTVTVKFNDLASSYTETLMTKGSSRSLSWTPAVATYAPLYTGSGGHNATITCETFASGVSLGSNTKTISVSWAAGTIPPTLASGWATASPVNTGLAAALSSTWIQGYSKAEVTFDSSKITTQYSATIASYSISCNGVTDSTSPYQTDVLPALSAAITCTVTDSRGQTASETIAVTLLPYGAPSITNVSIYRCLSDGTASESGTYIGVQGTTVISSLGGANSVSSFQAFVRQNGGSYGSGTNLTSGTLEKLSPYSPDTTYEVKLQLTDLVGTTTAVTAILPSRAWALKFRLNNGAISGAAIGKAAETDNTLEIAKGWAIRLHDLNTNSYADLDYDKLSRLLQLLT